MMGTQQQREPAHAALWAIPTYVGWALPQESGQLTTGADLGKVIDSILKAWRDKTRKADGGEAETAPECFRTCSDVIRSFEDLLAEPEEDEFGKVRPAGSAVVDAKGRLTQIAQGGVLPKPEDVGTDRDGGLRISWRNRNRFLELVFPYETDVRPYLYYSEGPVFDVSEDLADSRLRGWMRWVEGGTRPQSRPTASARQTQ